MEIIGIDNGNANTKTLSHTFVSGIRSHGQVIPTFRDNLIYYQGTYYSLTNQRITYQRNKTSAPDTFLLSLFGIAKELVDRGYREGSVEQIALGVGLPPQHYGSLKQRFTQYFEEKGHHVSYTYIHGDFSIDIEIEIVHVGVYPQAYAALVASDSPVSEYAQYYIVDIGGYTVDVLLMDDYRPDTSTCLSLDQGIIIQVGDLVGMLSSEYDISLSPRQVELVLQKKKTGLPQETVNLIMDKAESQTMALLNRLNELGIRLDSTPVLFTGGGAMLLQEFIRKGKFVQMDLIENIGANAEGYEILEQVYIDKTSPDLAE